MKESNVKSWYCELRISFIDLYYIKDVIVILVSTITNDLRTIDIYIKQLISNKPNNVNNDSFRFSKFKRRVLLRVPLVSFPRATDWEPLRYRIPSSSTGE